MLNNVPFFLRTLIESLPDPVICYDRMCHIVSINDRSRNSILRTYNDLSFLKACEVFGFNNGNKDRCRGCVYKRVQEENFKEVVEQEVVLPDGKKGFFSRHVARWEMNGETFLVEMWRDLSREQTIADEIRKKDLFIDGFLELFDIPMFITDEHFRIVGINRFFEKFARMPFSHLLGRSLWDIIKSSDGPSGSDTHDRSNRYYLRASLTRYPEEECNVKFYSIRQGGNCFGNVGFILKRWQTGVNPGYPHYEMEYFFEICREGSHKETLEEYFDFVEKLVAKHFRIGADILIILFNEEENNLLWLNEKDEKWPLQKQFRSFFKSKEHYSLLHAGVTGSFFQNIVVNSGNPSALPKLLVPFAANYPEWFGFPVATHRKVLGYFFLGFHEMTYQFRESMYLFHAFMAQMAGHIRQLVLRELEGRKENFLNSGIPNHFGRLIGSSKKMQEVYELIDLVALSEATVLVTGENGTGKELVALEIHHRSARSEGPFVVAHCSAYSPTLLESELFGHEKGAFTGAVKLKKGRIERAQGGTLFLDEIGDVAPATQVLLLRFLQDRKFERVGGEKTLEADVRIIAATNKDLYEEVKNGRFRDDLFYRLNVIAIHLPPLRERKEDIPLLAKHFLEKYSFKEKKNITSIDPGAMRIIMDYDWPGNVRQLENAISHAVVLAHSEEIIKAAHLPLFLRERASDNERVSLADYEKNLIRRTLEECKWNKHEAARKLNISRSTLYSKIRKYGLESLVFLS